MEDSLTNPEIAKYLNLETGLSRIRGNKKLFHKMLGMLLDSSEFERLDDAISKNDLVTAADSAHTIKGMTGNLSLDALFEITSRLTIQFRAGDSDQECIEAYHDTLEKTKAVIVAVRDELAGQI